MTNNLYKRDIVASFYPEIKVGGFSRVDGTIFFYSQVRALIRPTDRVLDFGAGRGEHLHDDPVAYRRDISNLKGHVALLVGADVDPVVKDNPFLDQADILSPEGGLPYPDNHFDLIVSRYVLEHVENAELISQELLRVLRPGGWFCATTPNRYGYVALVSRLIPNRLHARMLQRVQPGRKAEDVFPTFYRMNSKGALRRLFGHGGEVTVVGQSAEPAYYFGSRFLFGLIRAFHSILPEAFDTSFAVFVRKHGPTSLAQPES